ncbi:hypothetical protein DMENIID0001_093170 [Sergentomyia squamirostris]
MNLKCLEIKIPFIDNLSYSFNDWPRVYDKLSRVLDTVKTDNVLKHFAKYNRLEYLYFYLNPHDDDVESLTQFTNLKVLVLWMTPISEQTWEDIDGRENTLRWRFNDNILQRLSCKKTLQNLTLWGSMVTDQGVCDIIRDCPSLKFISLKNCVNISPNLEKKLQSMLGRRRPIKIVTTWNFRKKELSELLSH